MATSYFVIFISTTLIPLAGGPRPFALACLCVGYIFWGIGLGVFNVANVSFRQSVTPPASMATLMGTWRTVLFGTLPIGSLAGGMVASFGGLRAALWLGVVGNGIAFLILALSPGFRDRDIEPNISTVDKTATSTVN
jgi:MFS family permease